MEPCDYSGLQEAFRQGTIHAPDDILRYVGRNNRLFRDAGLSAYSWADRRWKDPLRFKIGEVQQLAETIGINWTDLIELLVENAPAK